MKEKIASSIVFSTVFLWCFFLIRAFFHNWYRPRDLSLSENWMAIFLSSVVILTWIIIEQRFLVRDLKGADYNIIYRLNKKKRFTGGRNQGTRLHNLFTFKEGPGSLIKHFFQNGYTSISHHVIYIVSFSAFFCHPLFCIHTAPLEAYNYYNNS